MTGFMWIVLYLYALKVYYARQWPVAEQWGLKIYQVLSVLHMNEWSRVLVEEAEHDSVIKDYVRTYMGVKSTLHKQYRFGHFLTMDCLNLILYVFKRFVGVFISILCVYVHIMIYKK